MSNDLMLATRRRFLGGLLASFLVPAESRAQPRCSTFGAIRWDAQYCDTQGEPCYEEEKALNPSGWRFRAPLHSVLSPNGTLQFKASQTTFDNEIRVAHEAGLSYWAYLSYGKDGLLDLNHSMMKGLSLHRSSGV